jgi:crossover junction endodeoxyribonuclease RuvC
LKVVGIDPGLSGALAVFDLKAKLLAVHDMPTVTVKSGKSEKRQLSESMLAGILRRAQPDHAFLEFVSAMPGQGVTSMFNFGLGYGAIRGVLAALDIPMTTVTPVKWKRDLGLAQGKDAGRARAAQLYPEFADLFMRVKDDGRADASLLAWWGAQTAYINLLRKDV